MAEPDFADLVARARAGDADAAVELTRAFEHDVRMMVRVRLPRALRAQFDSMDFVQAIWQSVLVHDGGDDAPVFHDPRQFRGYLAAVARNKVWEEYRRRSSKKYDLAREERLYVRRGGRDETREVAAPDPTPSEQLQAGDRLDQLLAGRSPTEAEAVRLRHEGRTFEEIAQATGLNERTVRRIFEGLRERWESRQWR